LGQAPVYRRFRYELMRFFRPFRAEIVCDDLDPGLRFAAPWAVLSRPFGAFEIDGTQTHQLNRGDGIPTSRDSMLPDRVRFILPILWAGCIAPISLFFVFLSFTATVLAADFEPNDFAIEVISYDDGGVSSHKDPCSALGRPAVDTDYFGAARPVVPVYAAWEQDQVVKIGFGGHLVLRFSHKVSDDENNPYGTDFIVFGNAFQKIGGDINWQYQDPAAVTISTNDVYVEPGLVSVSQDGLTWYGYNDPNLPRADTFAPTLGRIYDPNNAVDVYPGWLNQWWANVTNPTVPLDPNLAPVDFVGKTVAEVCGIYGESAGGTGFDLQDLAPADYASLLVDGQTGRRWIQYIKVEYTGSILYETEVDAVADVSCCGDYKHPFAGGDLNHDCRVNFLDFAVLASMWVDEEGLLALADNWLMCNWECD